MPSEANGNALERLEKLREAVKSARDEKVRLEERIKAKAEERDAILAELGEAGVSEDELEATIAKLSKKLEAELGKAEQIIASAEAPDPVAAADEAGGEFTANEFAAGEGEEFTQGDGDELDDLDDIV